MWVHDPLMAPIEVSYGIVKRFDRYFGNGGASGLPFGCPIGENPMKTTTYGVGEIVADALKSAC